MFWKKRPPLDSSCNFAHPMPKTKPSTAGPSPPHPTTRRVTRLPGPVGRSSARRRGRQLAAGSRSAVHRQRRRPPELEDGRDGSESPGVRARGSGFLTEGATTAALYTHLH